MSWQSYIDSEIKDKVSCNVAVIAGITDGQLWGHYVKEGLQPIIPTELKTIADTMRDNPNCFLEKGIHLGGEKYFCLSAENSLIRGRKDNRALCVVSTNATLVGAVTADNEPPGKLNTVVEKLGDYLKSMGY
ncbi:profilin-like [Oppia nitens]|uniref:profilin-like n=1 Tax=Oppia nitens TaxID=1686743 RepID=UPI0023DAD18D|nr:profilin-like [Oppia nitens]